MNTQDMIRDACKEIQNMLIQKNDEYGDSAINPVQIFSTSKPLELINIRIDDKLSRIKNKKIKKIKEDTVLDLIGYLILRRILEKKNAEIM